MDRAFKGKKVTVIIPAYNEESSVSSVVRTALAHPLTGEVIVIDDGSTDKTAEKALKAGAIVHRMRGNRGKGMAMHMGVKLASFDFICFLDADITGLSQDRLSRIITPVLLGRYDMHIAIRDRRVKWLNSALRFFPLIGGERALTKNLWREVPREYRKDFQIEIALNYFAKQNGRRIGFRLIPGLSQTIKEAKRGWLKGLWQRARMAADIANVSWRLYIMGGMPRGRAGFYGPNSAWE